MLNTRSQTQNNTVDVIQCMWSIKPDKTKLKCLEIHVLCGQVYKKKQGHYYHKSVQETLEWCVCAFVRMHVHTHTR